MRRLGVSIIGTDTDVGKTFVTGLLGALAVDDGFDVGMVKPVSSSAVPFSQCGTMDEDEICMGLESKDATYLMQSVGSPESRRREVNPIALAGDYSPRLAAELAGVDIDYPEIVNHVKRVVNQHDIDGRLGSINRVVLTYEYAKQHHIDVKGIIVNDTTVVDPFLLKTNIEDMERYTGIPVLGVLPPYQGPNQAHIKLGWGRSFLDSAKIWQTVWGI